MKERTLNLIYGLKDRKITHISQVEKGLDCGCFCPACGDRLIAKKGDVVRHHFAHQSDKPCEYGVETALHIAAKEFLATAKSFTIPEVKLRFPHSYKPDILIHESMKIEIDHVELEKHIDALIPDVVVYSGGKKLFIEICVTHPIDEKKLQKIINLGISTIEIDLGGDKDFPDEQELARIILENDSRKKWKYNAVEEKMLQQYKRNAEKMWIVNRGMSRHIDNCPLEKRVWNGKTYANVLDDCLNCDRLIEWKNMSDYILCMGR